MSASEPGRPGGSASISRVPVEWDPISSPANQYAQHARYGPTAVGLVYPVVLQNDQNLPAPFRVTGFSTDGHLYFLDVGHRAAENIAAFRTALLESAGEASLTLVA